MAAKSSLQSSVVIRGSSFTPATVQERLRHGVSCIPGVRDITQDDSQTWGTEAWTGIEIRTLLVNAIHEGLSLHRALDDLKSHHGRMPSYRTVNEWLERFPEFKRDYRAAMGARGRMMAEAALEEALDVDPETAAASKVKISALQWQASKLDSETYGEKKTVEMKDSTSRMSDDELDARISALMQNKQLVSAIGMTDQTIDVDIIEEGDGVQNDS